MKRFELSYLKSWYLKHNRKPLIIRGARQVGKSTLVRLFAAEQNLDLIEVNLERNRLRSHLSDSENPIQEILAELESYFNKKVHGKSLIFFDEIQQQPELMPKLRFFFEERPDIAIICAGSLLEFVLSEHQFSMPVGRIEFMHLGPMKFSEFLLNGNKENLWDQARNSFPSFNKHQYSQLTEQLKKYLFIGGMPEAVKTYFDTHSPKSVRDIHRNIMLTYKNDFSKYAKNKEIPRLEEVLEALPNQLGKKIKYSEFSPNLEHRQIKKALHLLHLARLVHICYHTNASGAPLESQKDLNVFKLYFLDVGLLNYLFDLSYTQIKEMSEDILLVNGIMAEQFAAQHLAFNRGPEEPPELFYWLRDKQAGNAEVDFVLSKENLITPIEIKSGKSGSIKSLIQFAKDKENKMAFRFDIKDRSNHPLEQFIENASNFELTNAHLAMIECMDRKWLTSETALF